MTRHLFAATALLALCGGAAHAQTTGCPAHATAYRIEDTPSATIIHCHCAGGFHAANGECAAPPPPPSTPRLSCSVAEERIRGDLEQIEKQRELATENRAQFAEANKLGKRGGKDLLIAAGELAAGAYAQDAEQVDEHVKELETEADTLSASVSTLKNNPQRYADLQKLKQVDAQLQHIKLSAAAKTLAKSGLDAKESWEMGEGAMHDGFTAAAGANDQLATELNDPEFHDALLGSTEEDDNPLYAHTATALKATISQVAESAKFLGHYKSITGPAITYTSFVIDGAYADLEIWFAAGSADQADQNAGQLARAAGLMQAKYRQDIQAKQICVP